MGRIFLMTTSTCIMFWPNLTLILEVRFEVVIKNILPNKYSYFCFEEHLHIWLDPLSWPSKPLWSITMSYLRKCYNCYYQVLKWRKIFYCAAALGSDFSVEWSWSKLWLLSLQWCNTSYNFRHFYSTVKCTKIL